MRDKTLYKGIFVYHFEQCKEFAWAYSEKQAKTIMCRRLADRQGVHASVVFGYFDGSKDNYRVQKEIELDPIKEEVAGHGTQNFRN